MAIASVAGQNQVEPFFFLLTRSDTNTHTLWKWRHPLSSLACRDAYYRRSRKGWGVGGGGSFKNVFALNQIMPEQISSSVPDWC